MKLHDFLQNIPLVVNSPSGIKHLSDLIHQFAMQGKLSAQKVDENVSAYTQQLDAERASVRRQSETDREIILSRGTIPTNWRWATLGSISHSIHYGVTAKAVFRRDGIRFLRITDIQDNQVDWTTVPSCDIEQQQIESSRLKDGDILIARTGGTIGKTYLVSGLRCDAVFASYLIRWIPLPSTFSPFVKLFTNSPMYWQQLFAATSGTGQPNVNASSLKRITLPIPPLEEQKRIVAKVNELMGLCDRLEVQQKQRETLLPVLSRATNARFAANPIPANFQTIFHRSGTSSPDDLRSTILTLAVQGRLVNQSPTDAPAEGLLESLRDRRSALQQELMVRDRVSVASSFFPSWASKIPDTWKLPVFDDVLVITSGVTKGRNLTGRRTIRLPYLRVANVQRWRLSLNQMKDIEVLEEDREKYRLLRGDIVMVEGGDWDKVGRAAIWDEEIEDCIHQNHIFRVRSPNKMSLLPQWIVLFVNSPVGREYFEDCAKQTTNLASINMTQLRACRLPLPPTAEQRRIVSKVEYLLTLVNQLESKQAKSKQVANLFASSAVDALTGTAFQERQIMKAPKTELVSKLKANVKKTNTAPLASLLSSQHGETSAKSLWQLSGLEVDAFYLQLKTEIDNGWISPGEKLMKEVEAS